MIFVDAKQSNTIINSSQHSNLLPRNQNNNNQAIGLHWMEREGKKRKQPKSSECTFPLHLFVSILSASSIASFNKNTILSVPLAAVFTIP